MPFQSKNGRKLSQHLHIENTWNSHSCYPGPPGILNIDHATLLLLGRSKWRPGFEEHGAHSRLRWTASTEKKMSHPFESISPLPPDVRQALIAMTSVGLTSLVTAGLLFCHITYKLVCWKVRDIKNQKEQLEQLGRSDTTRNSVDLNMGLAEDHYYQAKSRKPGDTAAFPSAQQEPSSDETKDHQIPAEVLPQLSLSTLREKPPSPLLLLIYNLLLSDVVLSASYANDAVWLNMDAIIAPSSTCTVQGWIVSCGCLTTSGFLFAISIFSYLGIMRGYKATQRDVFIACSIVWTLSVILSSLGPMYFRDATYYGRETTWVSRVFSFPPTPQNQQQQQKKREPR